MKRWLRRWLGIDYDITRAKSCVSELSDQVDSLQNQISANDQAFAQCAAEIEKFREELNARRENSKPEPRVVSFRNFRAAAERQPRR